MFTLIYILATPAFLGDYSSMDACKNAIREIYATQANPPGKRLPELEKGINVQVQFQKSYVCVPKG